MTRANAEFAHPESDQRSGSFATRLDAARDTASGRREPFIAEARRAAAVAMSDLPTACALYSHDIMTAAFTLSRATVDLHEASADRRYRAMLAACDEVEAMAVRARHLSAVLAAKLAQHINRNPEAGVRK